MVQIVKAKHHDKKMFQTLLQTGAAMVHKITLLQNEPNHEVLDFTIYSPIVTLSFFFIGRPTLAVKFIPLLLNFNGVNGNIMTFIYMN